DQRPGTRFPPPRWHPRSPRSPAVPTSAASGPGTHGCVRRLPVRRHARTTGSSVSARSPTPSECIAQLTDVGDVRRTHELRRCLHLVGDRGQEQTQGLQRVHRAHQDDGALSVLRGVAPYRRLAPVGGSYIGQRDRKSTRLNSSHVSISYAVFCLKKEI